MLDPAVTARLAADLVTQAGGYLRNPVRADGMTCAVCTAPVAAHQYCYRCDGHRFRTGLADATAFLTYAVSGEQSGYVMAGYKAPRPVAEHRTIVRLLLLTALSRHSRCPGALAGTPVTHWAAVPSLPARPGEHPVREIARIARPGPEITLLAATHAPYPQAVDPAHFAVKKMPHRRPHVLVLDDTWRSGGHAQSAALALHAAGAAVVSVLVAARCLNEELATNAAFLRRLAGRDYDPGICPWTGGSCPPGAQQR